MVNAEIYKNYDINAKVKNSEKKYYFIFKNNELLLINKELPLLENLDQLNLNIQREIFLGQFYSNDLYTVEIDDTNTSEFEFYNLQDVYDIDEELFLVGGRAIQIIDWDKNHKYCGRCGSETFVSDVERARVCPKCGFMSFTRIAPAIITAIIKDNQLLMAKHSYHSTDRYALIAGFIEAGETIEEAVKREVKEEVGINVKNLRYFSSQSCPFPNSLMLGFICEYDSGEIKVDNFEILDAKWFKKEEIKPISSISIASKLIEYFKENY